MTITGEQLKQQLQGANLDAVDPNNMKMTSPNQGEVGGVRGFLGEAAQSLVPFGDYRETTDMLREGGQESNLASRTLTGFAQGLSFGAIPTLNAFGEEVKARIQGNDDMTFRERQQASRETLRENSNLGGEIAGALAGGPRVIAKGLETGVKKLPVLGELLLTRGVKGALARGATASVVAGAETAAYSMAEGKDLDDAAMDGLIGMGMGGAFQVGADMFGAGIKALNLPGRLGFGTDEEAARAIVNNLRTHYGDDFIRNMYGEEMLDVDSIVRSMNAADEALIDTFPTALAADVKQLQKGSNNQRIYEASKPILDHLRNRQLSARPDFQSAVSGVINSPDVRTLDGVIAMAKEVTGDLTSAYDDALKPSSLDPRFVFPSGKAKPVKVSDIHAVIDRAFRSGGKVPEVAAVRDHLKALIGPADGTLTPRQLLTVRKSLDNYLFSGKLPQIGDFPDRPSISKEIMTQFAMPARMGVKQQLYKVAPKLGELDAKFADEVQLKQAFEAGLDLFSGKGANPDSYALFRSATDRTPMQVASFVEGVKRAMVDELDGKTARQVQNYLERNAEKFRFAEEVLGRDAVSQIKQNAEIYASREAVGRLLKSEGPPALEIDQSILPSITDAGILGSGFTKYGSTPAAQGAFRRLVQSFGLEGPGGNVGRAAAFSNLAAAPTEQAANQVNEELMRNLPSLMRGLPGFAPIASNED